MAAVTPFPFTAVVGQERVKRALVLNAVNPRVGGVLIRGEKGTAKSTLVRALAALLPEIDVVEGCPVGCDPERRDDLCDDCAARVAGGAALTRTRRRPRFETLPLGVTEDRLLGSIDIERAIQRGERRFEPGILARVNRGVLYVDEVNLLEDHIVDVLLDVAAMGVNVVEREGVSHTHPSSFVLVGTMNPEEGELRPQLLDRFGLCVDVVSSPDVAERAEIVARRLAFERDGASFAARFGAEERALGEAIAKGRARLGDVGVEAAVCEAAARLAVKIGVDGHRAEILTVKAAATLAAFERKSVVGGDEIARAAELVFPHRVKRRPFEERTLSADELAAAVREAVEGDRPTPPKKGRAVSPGV